MRRITHTTRENASPKLKAWRSSPRFKAIGRAAREKGLEMIRKMPKCGALTKRGTPCRALALENKRCRRHGGKTPKGAGWHKIRMPDRGEKRGVEKFEAKLAKKEQRERDNRRRLAKMTPEQRAKHEAWQASHVPGSKSTRAAAKAKREQADWFGGIVRDVDAKRAAATRPAAEPPIDFSTYAEGVFA